MSRLIEFRKAEQALREQLAQLDRLQTDNSLASTHGHEAEVMRLLGEIEALANEGQA